MKILGFLYVKTEILLQNAKLSHFSVSGKHAAPSTFGKRTKLALFFTKNRIAAVQNVELSSISPWNLLGKRRFRDVGRCANTKKNYMNRNNYVREKHVSPVNSQVKRTTPLPVGWRQPSHGRRI